MPATRSRQMTPPSFRVGGRTAQAPDEPAAAAERASLPRRSSPMLATLAAFLVLLTFYTAMVAAALAVELLFQALGLLPEERNAKIVEASVSWNYTTVLNIIFIMFAAVLVWRFVRTGGLPMLRMMNKPMSEHA
jgi:hypothetical protein